MAPALVNNIAGMASARIVQQRRQALADYDVAHQDNVSFGPQSEVLAGDVLDEVEADEAVWRKQSCGDNAVQWQEFIGVKRRGDRASLLLQERNPERSRSVGASDSQRLLASVLRMSRSAIVSHLIGGVLWARLSLPVLWIRDVQSRPPARARGPGERCACVRVGAIKCCYWLPYVSES